MFKYCHPINPQRSLLSSIITNLPTMASNQPAEESIAKRRSGTHQGVTDTAHAASVAGLTLRTEVVSLIYLTSAVTYLLDYTNT